MHACGDAHGHVEACRHGRVGRARETRVPSPTTRVSERLQHGFLSASEHLKLCDVITRAPRSSSASRKAPATPFYICLKKTARGGPRHATWGDPRVMHGPRDSRASRRRWNTQGVPWGQFKAAKHCGQNMSTSGIANQSTRCSIARAGPGLIGRTWRACVGGGQGPRLAEHPQQPARHTWLSFRQLTKVFR